MQRAQRLRVLLKRETVSLVLLYAAHAVHGAGVCRLADDVHILFDREERVLAGELGE